MKEIDITPTRAETIDPKQQRLAVLAEDTRTRMKRSALDIYHIGANLLEAQYLLAHGEFLPWIKAEFDMSQRSAYKFIGVAKAFQGKFAQNANLEISASALYLLASPEIPDDARNEAVELASSGETISPQKARKIVEKHTTVAQETAALGESLGMPTRGKSVLPDSDRLDDLTHSSPSDVDDRPGSALPLTPFEALKNSARRGIQGYLAGMGETAAAQALATVTTQTLGWDRHIDAVAQRFPRYERTALRPAIIKVFWEIAQGRKALTQSLDTMLPEVLAAHDNEYLSDMLQTEVEHDPEVVIAPTSAQWQAAKARIGELMQVVNDAQAEIERLTTENLKLKAELGKLNATCRS